MKLSILALLGAIGYFALTWAALVDPLSAWRYGALIGWIAVVIYFLVLATVQSSRAVFGRVALGGMVAYFQLAFAAQLAPYANQRQPTLPHELVVSLLPSPVVMQGFQPSPMAIEAGPVSGPTGDNLRRQSFREIIAIANSALLVGLIGGLVAGWHSQRGAKTE